MCENLPNSPDICRVTGGLRIPTHPVFGRAQVKKKDSVVLKSASVRVVLTDVIFVENSDTPVSGAVCDLPRARVTAEKYTVVLKSASVRT